MRIGIGIGVRVRGAGVDPADFLAGMTDLLDRRGIGADRSGTDVVFSAEDAITLADLARPVAEWWQSFEPSTRGDVALTMSGPGGSSSLTYCLPDRAVENIRHSIVTECGPRYEPGEEPGAVRRAAARVVRRVRTGFTASELHVSTDAGCSTVALTGRDLDDLPRSVEFQTADSDGYRLVNERQIPVVRALEGVWLDPGRVRLKLTHAAALDWELPSTGLTIRLRMGPEEIGRLRAGLRELFERCQGDRPRDLHL